MKIYDKLTFISHSDTCRGPMAEALMQERMLLEDIIIDSRGMIVLFPEPVNQKAEEVLEQNGLNMRDHEAQPVTRDDFDERTLILTMESSQKHKLCADYPEAAKNVYTLAEFCGQEGDGDVFNPLGRDLPEYGECFRQLSGMIEKAVVKMKEAENNDSDCL